AARALDAAHRMQRFLVDNPLYETPYGQFPFSIRVGLSWGRVAWGIVRMVHLSSPEATLGGASEQRPRPDRAFYYFQGPAIDASPAVEHRAQPGEVPLDPAFRRCVPEAEASPVDGAGGLFRAAASGKPARRLPASWHPPAPTPAAFLAPGISE